jgi:hypothetical protein
MRVKAAFIFFLKALLCRLLVPSVAYVGVYVTYVGLPILLISWFVMVFGPNKEDSDQVVTVAGRGVDPRRLQPTAGFQRSDG